MLENDYVDKILRGFGASSKVDIAAFQLQIPEGCYIKKRYWSNPCKITYKTALKISSWQIVFRRTSIIDNKIQFDENIGSGISKAGGEEKIFLHRCLECGLTIFYYPFMIGCVSHIQSQWIHHLFTKEYFVDWGYYSRRLHGGIPFATILCVFFALKKYKAYSDKTPFLIALCAMLKGIYLKK